jgi:hypothetical protein
MAPTFGPSISTDLNLGRVTKLSYSNNNLLLFKFCDDQHAIWLWQL